MAKRKLKGKYSFIRPVHLQALVFLAAYTLLSKAIFVKSLATKDPIIEFFGPYFFGVVAGAVFLFLFNHEDFFHFMKDVEAGEKRKEQTFLKKYLHFGKVLSTIIIATLGGPVFAALTARLLLNRFWYKYIVIAAGNITSTLIAVLLAKGALSLVF